MHSSQLFDDEIKRYLLQNFSGKEKCVQVGSYINANFLKKLPQEKTGFFKILLLDIKNPEGPWKFHQRITKKVIFSSKHRKKSANFVKKIAIKTYMSWKNCGKKFNFRERIVENTSLFIRELRKKLLLVN